MIVFGVSLDPFHSGGRSRVGLDRLSTGAGAEMRQTLGTGVFAGMLGVTFFGIFLTPVFYVVLQGLSERGNHETHETHEM